MKNTVATGSPINAPVWWIDPTDSEAHAIADGKISNRSNIKQSQIIIGSTDFCV